MFLKLSHEAEKLHSHDPLFNKKQGKAKKQIDRGEQNSGDAEKQETKKQKIKQEETEKQRGKETQRQKSKEAGN